MALRSFGKVVVTAGATPVRATSNLSDPTARVGVQGFTVQAHWNNTGKIYVFLGGAQFTGDHRTTLTGALFVVPAPGSATTGPFPTGSYGLQAEAAGINMADIFIQADVNGDSAIIAASIG
jgi:hypothetical protein